MTLLDTHIWLRWCFDESALAPAMLDMLRTLRPGGFGVSVVSCCETAWLVRSGRLRPNMPCLEWIDRAIQAPGVRLIELSPSIAVEAAQLPEPFHRDPADRLLVATARVHSCPILTADSKILAYPHVEKV